MKTPPHLLPVSVLSLDLEDPSEENFLQHLHRAIGQGSRWIVVPFGFPAVKSQDIYFSRLAKKHRIHLVAGFLQKRKRIAKIYEPSGKIAGEYAQTHQLPDEKFVPGNKLAPIQTKQGTVGLSIGSDIYFPEIHWSLAQQGADFLIHLDVDRGVNDHFYSTISPKVRAFDVHRPFLIARPSSNVLKLVHNEEMEIAGTPMNPSVIYDQNGAILASTGFSQGVATAQLRFEQHCISREKKSNTPVAKGLDVWKLYFNDSREKYFGLLRKPYAPKKKPSYSKRNIRVAILTHRFSEQLGKNDATLLELVNKACKQKPDIIICTEMEKEARPETPAIAATIKKVIAQSKRANAYMLIGGMRAHKPDSPQDRTSHGWLWNRKGERVFESIIMLYGKGVGQACFDTDFGRIGIRLCGDVYAPELDRLFALQGADIVLNPSMSWGASGSINTELSQARAMDNGHFIANAHLAFSDAGQRSHVIDPMGAILASSAYYESSVLVTDIDLDAPRGVFVKSGERKFDRHAYLAEYRGKHSHRLFSQQQLLKLRRPELYHMLDTDRPDHPFTTRDRGDGKLE